MPSLGVCLHFRAKYADTVAGVVGLIQFECSCCTDLGKHGWGSDNNDMEPDLYCLPR
jgi:hypothetical protein